MEISNLKQDIVFTEKLLGYHIILHSTWGLFSPKSVDEGTHLLLHNIDVPKGATILDLGCGYGPIGLALAAQDPTSHVHLVDKDYIAIEMAQKNIAANKLSNTTAYLSNGLSNVPPGTTFDVIASNVPAKIGSELLSIFLYDAKQFLNPGGKLYVVTISGLKEYMKRNLTTVFGNYEKLKQSKTYTAAVAIKG